MSRNERSASELRKKEFSELLNASTDDKDIEKANRFFERAILYDDLTKDERITISIYYLYISKSPILAMNMLKSVLDEEEEDNRKNYEDYLRRKKECEEEGVDYVIQPTYFESIAAKSLYNLSKILVGCRSTNVVFDDTYTLDSLSNINIYENIVKDMAEEKYENVERYISILLLRHANHFLCLVLLRHIYGLILNKKKKSNEPTTEILKAHQLVEEYIYQSLLTSSIAILDNIELVCLYEKKVKAGITVKDFNKIYESSANIMLAFKTNNARDTAIRYYINKPSEEYKIKHYHDLGIYLFDYNATKNKKVKTTKPAQKMKINCIIIISYGEKNFIDAFLSEKQSLNFFK